MTNRVLYNPDGYIEFIMDGDQTRDLFDDLKPGTDVINDMLSKSGKPRLGLVDLTNVGKFLSPKLNWSAMEMLESTNYEKLAIYGTNKVLKEIVNSIVRVMGKNSKTKIFADRDSAIKWLTSR